MMRSATLDDLERLLVLAAEMHKESRYACLPFAEDKVRRLAASLITSPGYFLRVTCAGEEIVGFIAAFAMEHYASYAKVASDFGIYITKEHRGGARAAQLLKAYKEWGEEQGAALIHAGVTTGVHTEASARLYEALGGKNVGVVFELGRFPCVQD